MAAPGAYLVWLNCFGPLLDGQDVDWSLSAPGIAFLFAAVVCLHQISAKQKDFTGPTSSAEIFTTPGVPWTPGLAIILNFFLMAQFNFQDHLIFFAFIALCVSCYVTYKAKHFFAKAARPSFRYSEYHREVATDFATCRPTEGN
jgi:hypothetical protein